MTLVVEKVGFDDICCARVAVKDAVCGDVLAGGAVFCAESRANDVHGALIIQDTISLDLPVIVEFGVDDVDCCACVIENRRAVT